MQSISFPAEALDALPPVTAAQMRTIHRKMLKVSRIPLHQMLERAGYLVYRVSACYTSAIFPRVMILLGKGFTGTTALLTAKCFANTGARVWLLMTAPRHKLKKVSREQLSILTEWYPEIPVHQVIRDTTNRLPEMTECDIIIDGMLGVGAHGTLREPLSTLVNLVNDVAVPTVSIELPTGLQPDTGEPSSPTILASATVTFTLPKKGFLNPRAHSYLGELYLANIGVCPKIIDQVIAEESYPRNLPEIMYLHTKNSFSRNT